MKEITILTETLAEELNSFIKDCSDFGIPADEAINNFMTQKLINIFDTDYKVKLTIEKL